MAGSYERKSRYYKGFRMTRLTLDRLMAVCEYYGLDMTNAVKMLISKEYKHIEFISQKRAKELARLQRELDGKNTPDI